MPDTLLETEDSEAAPPRADYNGTYSCWGHMIEAQWGTERQPDGGWKVQGCLTPIPTVGKTVQLKDGLYRFTEVKPMGNPATASSDTSSPPDSPLLLFPRSPLPLPMNIPTEHAEQAALLTWATLSTAAHPELRLLFAIPNGSFLGDGVKRLKSGKSVPLGAIRSRKLKAEGVKPGVPDLCLPVARGGFHGLYLEMKRTQGGTLSTDQKRWHSDLIEQGYHVITCKGQPQAQQQLTTYLTLPKTQLTKASQAHKSVLAVATSSQSESFVARKAKKEPNYTRKPTLRWATALHDLPPPCCSECNQDANDQAVPAETEASTH